MSQAREKFASQVNPQILTRVRTLAQSEGRQLQALVEEALADLIEKHKNAKPRAHVMGAYLASHDKYGPFTRSSLNERLPHHCRSAGDTFRPDRTLRRLPRRQGSRAARSRSLPAADWILRRSDRGSCCALGEPRAEPSFHRRQQAGRVRRHVHFSRHQRRASHGGCCRDLRFRGRPLCREPVPLRQACPLAARPRDARAAPKMTVYRLTIPPPILTPCL